MKLKQLIDEDEWYPVYEIKSISGYVHGKIVEVTPEFFERHNRIFAEFRALQSELCDMYEEPTSQQPL